MGKCKFWKKCKLYDEMSETCNRTDGMYGDREASCYRKMENKDEKL